MNIILTFVRIGSLLPNTTVNPKSCLGNALRLSSGAGSSKINGLTNTDSRKIDNSIPRRIIDPTKLTGNIVSWSDRRCWPTGWRWGGTTASGHATMTSIMAVTKSYVRLPRTVNRWSIT